jgi:crotonobetainyl-CoA:carnitine CoA-transferase CaiB-like acyl-CoA transferase
MAALTGIRVVDFSRVLAGPHCAQTLLDLGAEVIKIEPPSGDMSRRAYPRIGEISGYYAQQNAGKRNISIDPRRPDLAADPRFGTPQDRRHHLEALHEIVQRWIWTFTDVASLDAQLDEAKIPIGALRDISEFAETDWATHWGATRTVPDGAGGRITVPGRPWHFNAAAKPDERTDATETVDTGPEPDRQPARQGEHNDEVLRELGYSDDEISEFANRGVLVHKSHTN